MAVFTKIEALVSIVVPVYNAETYLEKCVHSLLTQSYRKVEIILVDDGSTDTSGRIIDRFAEQDSHIRVLHQRNSGVSVARNKGIELAQGEWIIFVDADDTIDPDYLEKLMSVSQDVDMVICGMKLIKDDNITFSKFFVDNNSKGNRLTTAELLQCIRLYVLSGPVCKLFKRSIINNNHIFFPKGMNLGEDTVFVYKYLQHTHLIYVLKRHGYNVLLSSNNSLTKRASPQETVEAYCKIYEIGTQVFKSKGIKNTINLDVFYVDGLLQAINKSNKSGIKLSTKERYHCYDLIADLHLSHPLYKKLPFFFLFFKHIRLWGGYEVLCKWLYPQQQIV